MSVIINMFLYLTLIGIGSCTICPHVSQWKFRASGYCNKSHPWYSCLYDENSMTNEEFCKTRPDFQRPGYKFVIRGDIDGKPCDDKRYQPIKFWTNGSSECILKKSDCTDIGQIVRNNGNITSNRKCQCDYTAGYTFVTKPKHGCYCDPAKEDCSCYLISCLSIEVLSPDYECINRMSWDGNFRCPLIDYQSMKSQSITRSTACPLTAGKQDEKEQEDPSWKEKACILVVSLSISRNFQNITGQTEKVQEDIQNVKEAGTVKRCIKVNFKDIVTTVKCEPIVDHLLSKRILTAFDKEQICLCLGPFKKNQKLLEIVWNNGIAACKEFLTALYSDPSYEHLVKQIKETKGYTDDYADELNIEFDGLRNIKMPKEISDLHEKYLLSWQKDDHKFIKTTVVQQVKKQLNDDNCVLVVGGPGTGKSSILRHVALYFCNTFGFDVVPVESGQSNILEFYNSNRKQVFVIDDICGKEHIIIQYVEIWKIKISQILELIENETQSIKESRKSRVKFLFSSRLNICEDRNFQLLDIPNAYKCYISEWKLTDDERQQMLQMYHTDNTEIKSGLQKECPVEDFDFRLLVRLSEGRTAEEMSQLFHSPLTFIETDLEKLKNSYFLSFRVVALCVLFGNKLKEEWFGEKSIPNNVKLALEEFYSEMNVDLKADSISKRIMEEMKQLERTRLHVYIKKLENVYCIENERIFDIAAKLCGQVFLCTFINHASSEFISERYAFDRSHQTHTTHMIILKDEHDLKRYFDRILKDLENGITYSTFHNSQLVSRIYRNELCKYFDRRHSKIKEVFLQLNRREKENVQDEDNITNLDQSNKRSSFILLSSRMYSYTQRSNVPIIESIWLGHSDLVSQVIKIICNVNETDRFERSALLIASFLGHLEIVKMLVENGAKVSVCDKQGRSPIFAACEEGHDSVVEYLVCKGANVLISNLHERSPLYIACATGHKSIVEFLLRKNKQNISKSDVLHETPLFIAAASGRKDIVEILLENGADTCQKECSPLFIAAMHGHYKVVELLLARKFDTTQTDHDSRSMLFIASQEGHSEIVKLLIEYNESLISKCNWCSKSPLFVACERGHLKVVETLIKKDADVNQCDENKKSPLYISCEKGYLDIVKQLLQKKANIKNFDRDGRSPFYVASRGGFVQIMQELLSNGADPSHCNKWAASVLNITCREGHVEAVKLLLRYNADVFKEDAIGNTPIYVAAEEGYASIVNILLENNADINVLNKQFKTPLHAACNRGQEEVVEILLTKNARKNLKDKNKDTPYDIAKQRGYKSIMALFQHNQEGVLVST